MSRLITLERAKQICSHWHGGQWSAYYQFSCTGYMIENCLHYLKETEDNLHPEYALHPGTLTKKDERELNSLKRYFIACGKSYGLDFTYEKNKSYGYMMPKICNDVPQETLDKIIKLAYLI